MDDLRDRLKRLYVGSSPTSRRFRVAGVIFEICLIGFFILTSFASGQAWVAYGELAIGGILLADFLIRWWITQPPAAYFRRVSTWTDLVVLVTLFVPAFTQSLLFLRVMRAVRVFRSYNLLREIYSQYALIRQYRDTIQASVNLLVFVFVMSAAVYVLEAQRHPSIQNFVDALYFTVSTLSTTGFGDIVFKDTPGRLLSIFIMLVGVGLFLRLMQTIFRPAKVTYECPDCGLTRHEPDAVHCKHCGRLLHIQTEGED